FSLDTLLHLRRRRLMARSQLTPHSVAPAAPGIRPCLAGDGDELPQVTPVAQGQCEHAIHAADLHFAIGNDQGVGRVEPTPTGAHDNLPDAVRGIGCTGGGLGREPLVVLHVRVDDQLGARSIQIVPERLYTAGWEERARGGRVVPWVVP